MHYPFTSIIFMSYLPDYALDGYKYYPMDFMVKPINLLRLKSTVSMVNNYKNKRKKKISISSNGRIHLIDIESILYIEKVGRKSCINLENGRIIECNQGLTILEASRMVKPWLHSIILPFSRLMHDFLPTFSI